jgi:predicted transcriptional regulator
MRSKPECERAAKKPRKRPNRQLISASLGISRVAVSRYLRAEMTEPAYPERRSASATDKYAF